MKEIYTATYTLTEVPQIAARLKQFLSSGAVMTFTGPLGAGKTTLVKELLKQMGITDTVTSPTFAYVNEYRDNEGTIYYHFDLYRIGSLDAFTSAGFDEYLFAPNSKALIEWPAPIMPLLTRSSYHVAIDYAPDQSKRTICVTQ